MHLMEDNLLVYVPHNLMMDKQFFFHFLFKSAIRNCVYQINIFKCFISNLQQTFNN
jgi:hypothetical protein